MGPTIPTDKLWSLLNPGVTFPHLNFWIEKIKSFGWFGSIDPKNVYAAARIIATSTNKNLVDTVARSMEPYIDSLVWFVADMVRGGKSSGAGDSTSSRGNFSAFPFIGFYGTKFSEFYLYDYPKNKIVDQDLLPEIFPAGAYIKDDHHKIPMEMVEALAKSKIEIASLYAEERSRMSFAEQFGQTAQEMAKQANELFVLGVTPQDPVMHAVVGAMEIDFDSKKYAEREFSSINDSLLAGAIERFLYYISTNDETGIVEIPEGQGNPETRSGRNTIRSYALTNNMIGIYFGFFSPVIGDEIPETTAPEKTEESSPPELMEPIEPPESIHEEGSISPSNDGGQSSRPPSATPQAAQSGSLWPWITAAFLVLRNM